MSINEDYETLEDLACHAVRKTGAIKICRRHIIPVRSGDPDGERYAYAYATKVLKNAGKMFMIDELKQLIKHKLDAAADRTCPKCAEALRRERACLSETN